MKKKKKVSRNRKTKTRLKPVKKVKRKSVPIKIMTPPFKVLDSHVFEARAQPFGNPQYEIGMLFSRDTDLTFLNRTAAAVAASRWGKNRKKWPRGIQLPRFPRAVYATAHVVRVRSSNKPGVIDDSGTGRMLTSKDFYDGCHARATLVAYAYDTKKARGVTFFLNNLQKLEDPFSQEA